MCNVPMTALGVLLFGLLAWLAAVRITASVVHVESCSCVPWAS